MVATTDSIKAHLRSSLAHKYIEASITITDDADITDKINWKSVRKVEVTSPLGVEIELEHTGMTGVNTKEISGDYNFEGTFKAGPINGKTTSAQSFTFFPFSPEAKIQSDIQFDSTIVKGQNTIAATLANGEFSVVSNTNAFENTFTHDAELSFNNNKLSMKCDASATALGMKIRNQAEASAGAGEFIIRIETNGDHSENRVYSLMTSSLDVNGLTINCDANAKLLENEAVHKASLKMNKDGLTTSGTTTIHSPLSMENTFSAGLDATGATLSIANKAAVNDIKVDNTNSLTLTLSTLDFNSKAEATASEYTSYTHDITFNLKPYSASGNVNNQLKLLAANFINEAELQAELYKIDLTGSLKAFSGEEEIKHTYQINYADFNANAKCSTTGKVFGSHMSHNTELEIFGLAARFNNDARFNSHSMRFDHTIRCSIVPFDFNLDSIFNADGDMMLYGKHSAQLYGKFLLRAQPLAFASSHECRASVTQQLDNGFSLETTYQNKMDTTLSPEEQKTSFKIKSKMNEHVFNQDIDVYNTAERIGVEVSGTILTNIANRASSENQEFTISGFLKYDKSTESHIIHLPLIESLPAFLESIKGFVVYVAEAMQSFLTHEKVHDVLESVPKHINDFAEKMDLEGKANQLMQYFNDFTQNVAISMDDVDASLANLKIAVEKLLADVVVYIQVFAGMIKNTIVNGMLPETFIQKLQEVLNAINEKYDIKAALVNVIDTIREMIDQINLETLKDSSIAFLNDIEGRYEVKAKVNTLLTEVRDTIETFDVEEFFVELKEIISSLFFYINRFIKTAVKEIPTEMITYITHTMQDYDIVDNIKTLYAKMRELFGQLKVQDILEKSVELIKQLRIEEYINAVVKVVKEADIPNKFIEILQNAIDYLKTTEVKEIIEQLNIYIETAVQNLKSLDYNTFVDHSNRIIVEYTTYLNEMIRTLEIPQKLETAREFVNTVLSSIQDFVERLREIKVAEMIKSAKEFTEQFVSAPIKTFAEYIKNEVIQQDIKVEVSVILNLMRDLYREAITIISDAVTEIFAVFKIVLPDQKIIGEIQQIIDGFLSELKNAEINLPSFPIPLTDIVVPSTRLNIDMLKSFEIPTQLDIPEFTIMGTYTVQATTISWENIKQKIIALIDFILNSEVKMLDVDAFFGDLTLNYLPTLPGITLPQITLPEITIPTIPQVPVEKLVQSLQVPEIKLPPIPSEIMVPCFGKLHGGIKLETPIYTIKTSVEFQNSTETTTTPLFTGFFSSQGTSPTLEILNYNFDSNARFVIPKMKRIVLAETVKFSHVALGVDHQASVTLYGRSAQAQSKTGFKVTTSPYTATFLNTAFIGVERGMTVTIDTDYNHQVDIPVAGFQSEVTLTQKSLVQQNGFTLSVTGDNTGTAKFNDHNGKHSSNVQLSITPSDFTLSFTGDTDSTVLKMKQLITAEARLLNYFRFNVSNKAEAPVIKNSVFEVYGMGRLWEMQMDLKAKHDTELHGGDSGTISNAFNFKIRPVEFVFEFENKGNARVNIFKSLTAKINLQNDYLVNLNRDSQKISTVFLARLNQYKIFSNLTLDNNVNEAGIFVAMDGEANLDFLKYPISIPEIDLPIIVFHSPAITDLNLYEDTGLQNILTTTEQAVGVNAKMVYKKSLAPPLADVMGLIYIPSLGNLITDLSFKSAIINLNANTELSIEDDLVFRLAATTASVFESLKAKLDGTTRMTTKRGFKLANSLSLENPHFEGNHDSTISISTETFESAVSVETSAKIALPILSLDVSQNLGAETNSKANLLSNLKMKGDVNIPMIYAVGKTEAEHSLKLEGTFEYVSIESSIKSNMDSTLLENYLAFGVLDNEANLYLNKDGLRTTSKVIADAKLNHGTTKVISMDLKSNLAAEASMDRAYAELKHEVNNEANLFSFNTKGKHQANIFIDFVPISSLTADIEIDMNQSSSLGDLRFFEKSVTEVTTAKQKISIKTNFVSPLYTTNMEWTVEGNAPVFRVIFKSSASSTIVVLEYDLDGELIMN